MVTAPPGSLNLDPEPGVTRDTDTSPAWPRYPNLPQFSPLGCPTSNPALRTPMPGAPRLRPGLEARSPPETLSPSRKTKNLDTTTLLQQR